MLEGRIRKGPIQFQDHTPPGKSSFAELLGDFLGLDSENHKITGFEGWIQPPDMFRWSIQDTFRKLPVSRGWSVQGS